MSLKVSDVSGPKKKKPVEVTKKARVEEKIWGPDDTYLTVEVQVFTTEGFKEGDEVEVTVKKVKKDDQR